MNRDSRQVLTEWLVLKAQQGDERAFSDLFDLWSGDLRRLAAVQVEKVEYAEEVAQDAWVTIAKGLRRLNDPACFPRWAFRILDRRCADWIRRRQVDRKRAEVLAADEIHEPTVRHSSDADDVIALRESIARLEPESRKLLHLFYEVGFSTAEIAEVLGVPPGTVKSRLFKVRETLKNQIERIQL